MQSSNRMIKKKLYSATCMLLVSVLLLTTTSFAWLSLSTAPEVIGVSSIMGANGSLEIALASEEHLNELQENDMYEEGESSTLAAGVPYTDNTLWGNIVDLSDSRYGLDRVVLRPSELNILSDTVQIKNPLLVASYGMDGRIAHLANYSSVGGYDDKNLNYVTLKGKDYGVRVAGIPANAELVNRINMISEKVQQYAIQVLVQNSALLMEVFYSGLTSSERYNLREVQDLMEEIHLLDASYLQTIESVHGAFSGNSKDPDESSLLQKIEKNYNDTRACLELADANLEALVPEAAGDGTLPDPATVQLRYDQVLSVLEPLIGKPVFYQWQPGEDQSTYEWNVIEKGSVSNGKLRGELEGGCYFRQMGIMYGGYEAEGALDSTDADTIQWAAVADAPGLVYELGDESMQSKYLEFLRQFKELSAQYDMQLSKFTELLNDEYKDEVNFFYEDTLYPIEPFNVQPFRVGELESYQQRISDRIDGLVEVTDYLEDYAEKALLVYVSSGIVDREIYVNVINTACDTDATLRDYIEAAELMSNSNFTDIMKVCESVKAVAEEWELAVEELEQTLEPKDDDGNVIEDQVREMTVVDLLVLWDVVEEMSTMAVAGYSYDSFRDNAKQLFVDMIKSIDLPTTSGIFGILAREQGDAKRDYYDVRTKVTVSANTYREDSDTQYLADKEILLDAVSSGFSYSRIHASKSEFVSLFHDVSNHTLWKQANAYAEEAIGTFDNSSVSAVVSPLVADLVTERIVSGASDGYSSAYYTRLGTVLAETGVIAEQFEEVIASQALLYAAGLAAREEAENERSEENPVTEARDAYTLALNNWNAGVWDIEELLTYIIVTDNEYFDKILEAYRKVEKELQTAETAYGRLTERKLTWSELESVLICYTAKSPMEITVIDYDLIANVNGGIFAEAGHVFTDRNAIGDRHLPYASDWNEELRKTGLPNDIDAEYGKVGLLNTKDRTVTYSDIHCENVIAQIEFLIDRCTEAQDNSTSDREFVYESSAIQMNSEAALAKRYYSDYAENESAIFSLLNQCVIRAAEIILETGEEESGDQKERLTYTREELQAAEEALYALREAVVTAQNSIKHMLRAYAASHITGELEYEQTIQQEAVLQMMESLGIDEDDELYELYIELEVLYDALDSAYTALNSLTADDAHWSGNDKLTDAELEELLMKQVFSHIAPLEAITINDLPVDQYADSIAELDKVSGELQKTGIWICVEEGAIVSAHNQFETEKTICRVYTGDTIAVGTPEMSLDGIQTMSMIACHPEQHFETVVTWIDELGTSEYSTASGLNINSNYIIHETYAIAIDMLFRTNAVSSNLLLQTEEAQRIYSEEQLQEIKNSFTEEVMEEMMGKGSYIQLVNNDPSYDPIWTILENQKYTEEYDSALNTIGAGILRSLKMVFADTLTGKVYASADVADLNCDTENHTLTGYLELNEDEILALAQNQVAAVTAWIYLDGKSIDNSMIDSEVLSRLKINLQFATDAELYPAKQNIKSHEVQ